MKGTPACSLGLPTAKGFRSQQLKSRVVCMWLLEQCENAPATALPLTWNHAQHIKLGRGKGISGVTVRHDRPLLLWKQFNTCLLMGSKKLIPCFDLLVCMAFALHIELYLNSQIFSLLPFRSSPPSHQGRVSEWLRGAELLAEVKPQHLPKSIPYLCLCCVLSGWDDWAGGTHSFSYCSSASEGSSLGNRDAVFLAPASDLGSCKFVLGS